MKRLIFMAMAAFAALGALAQVTWHSADTLMLLGKVNDSTETRYERLPASLKGQVRDKQWDLGKNTAGLAVRFATNSPKVAVKWDVLQRNHMNHMTDRGIEGVDLYCLGCDGWRFVNSAVPNGEGHGEVSLVDNMVPTWREFMLNLPLYDGVTSLEIGVDSAYQLSNPQETSPVREKPIVYYGTSITQGGCASRPGMAHTNILARNLDREVINLGFSGNGKLDLPLAQLMAQVDASVFVIDCMPNCDVEIVRERFVPFYNAIRQAHPTTPILVIENPIFSHANFDPTVWEKLNALNAELRAQYETVADANSQLLSPGTGSGEDWEGTVDRIHFTDLGFQRYAAWLLPYLESSLNH
ncbi:MAG: SGNH/GDSL hydrolase family protein [Bacteroidales bacterium]|nr:SGNH/GDSL hydrolase family protein [Bacteroidales bacterium]